MQDTPVYLVTGFLESGKTTFIQQTLMDKRFCEGEKILVLLCESGEVELDPGEFASSEVYLEEISDPEALSPESLIILQKRHNATKILVEYNGMWQMSTIFNAAPEHWIIGQQILFFDSTTFAAYNQNMRSLVVDKIQSADMIVFNRMAPGADFMELHKIVRGLSRMAAIVYEDVNGETSYDDIEDPLPYDMEAPVIVIEDRDYAIFYRDLCENLSAYHGKTVQFKAMVAKEKSLGTGWMFVGRHVMTCCVEDIQYSAMICKWGRSDDYKSYDWVTVTGEIQVKNHKVYAGEGPVLIAQKAEAASEPDPPVATFY